MSPVKDRHSQRHDVRGNEAGLKGFMESKSRALRLGLIEGSSDKDESAETVHAYESVGEVAETRMIRMKEFRCTKDGCLESGRLRSSYGRRGWHGVENVIISQAISTLDLTTCRGIFLRWYQTS